VDLLILLEYHLHKNLHSNAQSFASVFEGTQKCQNYEELLDHPEIEIVYIGTPHSLHHRQCIQALESGKHVLCEKPVTFTSEEAKELSELATSNSKVLLVGHTFLYNES